MTLVTILKGFFEGTFIDEVMKLAEKGDFREIPEIPAAPEGVEPLGELLLTEKTFISYSVIKNEEALDMVRSGLPLSDEKVQHQLMLAHGALETAKTLMRDRFRNKSFDLRQGWKIFEIKDDDKSVCDCPFCRAARSGDNPTLADLLDLGSLIAGKDSFSG